MALLLNPWPITACLRRQALTASTNNDKITIKDLGGTLITAQSVYGGEGNDVIALGAAGLTATASANINAPTFATGAVKIVTGEVVLYGSAGTTYSDLSSSPTPLTALAALLLSQLRVSDSDAGARTISQALFQANAGNDSISLGDSLPPLPHLPSQVEQVTTSSALTPT